MSRFFQKEEIVAHAGEKTQFKNVDFTEGDFLENSPGAAAGTLLEILPVHIKNPPIIVWLEGTSLIPKIGIHTQKIPPITSVKDKSVSSAAGIVFEPNVYNIMPKQTNDP